jgi:hypothetical protein
MSLQEIQQGITAVQNGDYQQAEQLLRSGLQSQQVTGSVRAVALMWLAETNPSIQFKIQCYQAAVQADPHNIDIQSRLGTLIASQAPSPSVPQNPNPSQNAGGGALQRPHLPPRGTPAPQSLPGDGTGPLRAQQQNPNVPRMWEFGIEGGPNGVGTGFLIVRDGLVATSRFVVGSAADVTLLTRDGQTVRGHVVRSFPRYDLAFIRINVQVPFLRDMTPTPTVAPGTQLVADDYTEQEARAECRHTRQTIPAGWFPTTFPDSLPTSFNGSPLIDDRDDLVGMLTRNVARNSGHLYGLHVSVIRQKIEVYYNEMRHDPDRVYCGTCGNLSKAGAEGLYYCETCGALFPFAVKLHRTPHPKANLYYDVEEGR